jgi:hypothetical protein
VHDMCGHEEKAAGQQRAKGFHRTDKTWWETDDTSTACGKRWGRGVCTSEATGRRRGMGRI